MNPFYVTVTSPGTPIAIHGVLVLSEDGTLVGGDDATTWRGTATDTAGFYVEVKNMQRVTATGRHAALSKVFGDFHLDSFLKSGVLAGKGITTAHAGQAGAQVDIEIRAVAF